MSKIEEVRSSFDKALDVVDGDMDHVCARPGSSQYDDRNALSGQVFEGFGPCRPDLDGGND
jgi:hypothetical protein